MGGASQVFNYLFKHGLHRFTGYSLHTTLTLSAPTKNERNTLCVIHLSSRDKDNNFLYKTASMQCRYPVDFLNSFPKM